GAEWKIGVYSGTKSDQSEPLTTRHRLTGGGPAHDPARQQSSHLDAQHLRPGGGANHERVLLVAQGSVRPIRSEEPSWLIDNVFNLSITGNPIDMHIEDAEEDTQTDPLFFEKPGLIFLLNRHHAAVTRRDHHPCAVRNESSWVPEKPGCEQRDRAQHECRNGPAERSGHHCRPSCGCDEREPFSDYRNSDCPVCHPSILFHTLKADHTFSSCLCPRACPS